MVLVHEHISFSVPWIVSIVPDRSSPRSQSLASTSRPTFSAFLPNFWFRKYLNLFLCFFWTLGQSLLCIFREITKCWKYAQSQRGLKIPHWKLFYMKSHLNENIYVCFMFAHYSNLLFFLCKFIAHVFNLAIFHSSAA